MSGEYTLSFPGADSGEANELAADLEKTILDSHPNAKAEQKRADPSGMDFGTIVGVIVGSQAALAIAEGIQTWLASHRSVKLRIRQPNGEVIEADNLTGKQAIDLSKVFKEK